MTLDGTYTAVVDRIEESIATLVVEGSDDELYELLLDEDELPPEARHADAVLEVVLDADELVDVTYDETETVERRDGAQRRFDRLSRRPPRDDDEE